MACGKFTDNSEICEYCGRPFITEQSVKKTIQKRQKERLSEPLKELKIVTVLNKMKSHKFMLVRVIGTILNSIFMALVFIVSAIAYFIATIAA